MRFCQAFMSELYPPHRARHRPCRQATSAWADAEIGFLFGQYKKLRNEFTGVLTGKASTGAAAASGKKPPATGLVYFVEEMLRTKSNSHSGRW